MKPRWVGCLLLGVGVTLAVVLASVPPPLRAIATEWRPADATRPLGVTLVAMLVVTGMLILATSRGSAGASTTLRLDHFLPFLRKKKQKEPLRELPWWQRLARRILPTVLFADREAGKPGVIRKALKRLGPSVLSAPFRRVVQGVCFVAFLWLFFVVCWPYSSRPAPPAQVSAGWRLSHVDQATGRIDVTSENVAPLAVPRGTTVFLVDESALDAIRGEFGEFRVTTAAGNERTLEPARPLDESQWIALLTATNTWSLHDRSPWPRHYTDDLAAKERLPAESFLAIDPLLSLSTAVAARSWVWSLVSAAAILLVCVVIPRGFCGYLCPLGTLIDLFDWSIAARVKRFRVPDDGWWVHIKYYLLTGVLIAALCGVLLSGYVAAIPVITRGLLFLGDPLQTGLLRGWEHVPPLHWGHAVSIGLFFAVLGLGFLRPRFWCKYVCPSGAVFSVGNLFRATERKVESSCIHCNKCVEICPFDAIKPDFTTRGSDCTLCQTCAGVCPTHAIKFVERWNLVELKTLNDPPTHETTLGRRGFVSLAAGTVAAAVGGVGLAATTKLFGANLDDPNQPRPVRPPGSVPEREFLQMCIRCGECFKACPFNVLQPLGFQQGLEGLWTPHVVADHAGCAPSCNACGQVCPTGAIRALPLEEKRVARMGLAIVNPRTCLPFADREACQLCVDECTAAGYHAIEFTGVHTKTNEQGEPIEGTGYLAPVVLADKCVGCGLCQMECYRVNVSQKHLLTESAIIIKAGSDREDRMLTGSYLDLRRTPRSSALDTPPAVNVPESSPPAAETDPF